VYAASEGLSTIVIEPEAIGGQAGTSSLLRNYLGFPAGISGAELTQRAYQQAWLFGTKFVFARGVSHLRASGVNRILTLSDGTEITVRAVIAAPGASQNPEHRKSDSRECALSAV
jgi:thioredoxin reductase (NADPH)